ncbi:unnamed protein product [Prunus armeniaca]
MGDNSIVGVVADASTNLCVYDSIPSTGSNTWIIDTGASDQMTYDAKFFDELSSNTRDPYITSANGLPSPITGEGTISLIPTLSLSRALLVPNIHCSLLSVDRGLYYLTLPSAPVRGHVVNTVQSCSVKDKQQIWLWHRHLGHPSFGYLKHLFPSLFRYCDKSSFKCETCILAKSHRTVFPLSDNKAAKPFDLVHSNVWGPARVTSNKFRWFVTLIDNCTRLTWVFLLKNKHDVASILPEFCTMVSTQFNAQGKVFQTDNGGEYVNNTLASFFRAQGIIHQTTTSFTPQQNGVSERKNRQLLEVARSLMLDISVPHHLWGYAVLSAAYLINRTPSRVLDFKTPYDVFGDHVSPVSISKLPPKVFGCVAYVHVYSHQRSKLDPCALRCVFIGYSSTQKGYKCYHPPTQKGHVTLDVNFHEEVPYYVSPSSPIQGESGSELESLGLENDVFEDAALGKETTCRTEASDRSPISEDETCGPYEETTDRPLELDQSPISGDEAGALGVTEGSDQSPVSENNDSDSCMDEFDVIPSSALPLPQSTRDSESSEVISNDLPVSTYQLPPRTTRGKPKVQYSPDIHAKSKYPISHFVSTHHLSKSYASYLCQLSSVCVPTKLQDALSNPKWMDAMNVEMDALNKNKTWDLVPLSRGKTAVGCRWVFTLKHKADGSIDRYKARLVAKGYTQTYGVDYLETFAPVATLNTVRVLLSLAANRDWPLLQFDVKNAFLHGDLKEEIYMDLPPGIPVTSKEGVVCKLRKSLYGLKQSLRAWFARFAASMKKFGYVQSNSDHTLSLKRHKETGMLDCKPIDTPSEHNHKLGLYPDQVPADKERYQRLVGKLIYLSHTRPDIAYAVSVVSQFMHSLSEYHMGAVMRILRYLKVTPGKGLMFCNYGHTDVEGYTDADWAGSVTDKRSTFGYFTFVGGNLVTWRSKKQKVVSRSNAEAEYRGMAQGVCELLWLRRLLRDLGFGPLKPMDLYCDNKAAIAIAHNPVQHDRTKHVEVDRHFVKEKLDVEIISFPFISSEYQLADVLTKAVSTTVFLNSLDKLGMRDIIAPT